MPRFTLYIGIMALSHICLCFVLLKTLLYEAHCNPQDDGWYVDVEYTFLYEHFRNSAHSYYSKDFSKDVLTAILQNERIEDTLICFEDARILLHSKLRKLGADLKKIRVKGGMQLKILLKQWGKKQFRLNLKSSNLKRKLESDAMCETRKRQQIEATLEKSQNDVKRLQKVVSGIFKRKFQLGGPSSKTNCSKRWTQKKKKIFQKNVDEYFALLQGQGFSAASITVTDIHGNIIEASQNGAQHSKTYSVTKDVHTSLLIKDKFKISDKAYLKLASNSKLPSLRKLKSLSRELNSNFDIKHFSNCTGVYERLSTKLQRVMENIVQMDEKILESSHLLDNSFIGVRLSGDGTWVGKRLHLVNFTFSVLTKSFCSGTHLLAILKVYEKHSTLSDVLTPITEDIRNVTEVSCRDKVYKVKFFLAGDMKFLNTIMGIGACSSKFSCLWCFCSAVDRGDTRKTWSMTDENKGARTTMKIKQLSKQKRLNYSCVGSPVFQDIPISNVVPDVLHMYLRISDQLNNQLIMELMKRDKINKNSREYDRKKQVNMAKFEKFIKELKIEWSIYVDKDSGMLKFRDFTGVEHRKIQEQISIADLIPGHVHVNKIAQLWADFKQLMQLVKEKDCSEESVALLESKARDWVHMYGELYLFKNITPYMHVLMNHFPEAMALHGDLNLFSMQGLEKLNDQVTQWYFRSTNHYSIESLKQIMEKQGRVEYLSSRCCLTKFSISCGICGKQGHNKRTCPQACPQV